MENENTPIETNSTGIQGDDTAPDYIATIQQLRDSTVSKEQYQKVKDENQRLLKTLVEGGQLEQSSTAQDTMSIDELRNNLMHEDMTNLEYWQTALDLRKKLMDKGQKDPFLPWSKDYVPTEQDIATAKRVADVVGQCIDYADGDSSIFTNELQRVTVDTSIPQRNIKKGVY